MEALFPSSFLSSSDWFVDSSQGETIWTKEENKAFESALAIYGEDTPDRWMRVAEMIPGKTVWDVLKQYRELEDDICDIEAGKVPIPGYLASSFTLGLIGGTRDFDGCRKRHSGSKPNSDQERKKGVPWTEEEHKRFLLGLLKYGKGDWRNISRNFVVSKTPTQVASHAQKYYQRQQSGGKDKRRPSIHDITTYNVSPNSSLLLSQSLKLCDDNSDAISLPKTGWPWPTDGLFAVFASNNVSARSSYEAASNGLKFQEQNLYAYSCDIPLHPHSSVF